jgi:dTMP kinase
MSRGLVISFEGCEGSGKTTQFNLLCLHLNNVGIPYEAYREPGGTEISEEIRGMLLRPRNTTVSPLLELLLFEAARTEMIYAKVQPAIESGLLVLLDRYIDSSSAYQGYGRGLDLDVVASLNRLATNGIRPDKTFYFDVEPGFGLGRGTQDGKDRIEAEELAFHDRVRAGYLDLAMKEPERFVILNGHEPIETIIAQVIKELNRLLLERWGYEGYSAESHT